MSERIAELRHARGLSQAQLAKLVGVKQPTIGKLEAGISASSSHLHKIARALGTTVDYLAGDIDDPDEGAPPPPPKPTVQVATMQVLLPDERALKAMFRGILRASEGLSLDDTAQELARMLPRGLGLLQGPLVFEDSAPDDAQSDAAESEHDERPARRRA